MNEKSLIRYNNIYFLPSFHNRLQFSIEVRKVFASYEPNIIAVELPDIYYSDIIQAVGRLPKLTMLCLDHDNDVYTYIPIFPSDSMIEGIRIAKDNSLPISFIDLAVKEYTLHNENFIPPDDYAINIIGLEKFYEINKDYLQSKNNEDIKRESHMAFHLDLLSQRYEKVLFIGGFSHWESIKKHLEEKTFKYYPHELDSIKSPFLAKPSDKALYALLGEMPYLVFQYEIFRRFNLEYKQWNIILKLLQEAKKTPLLENENYTPREFNNLIQYAKKLTFIDNKILPDLYNLLLSAKQTLGDDYGIELLELALKYPFKEKEDLPIIDVSIDKKSFELFGRKITLERKLPDYNLVSEPENKWQELNLVRKKRDELPDSYISDWFFFGFFSHIPEDLIIEGFIDRLKNKLLSDLTKEPKVKEFTGSLLDGLDVRETIRNFHEKKIYVKEFNHKRIDIKTWILLFDDELTYEKYPWGMSLSAEHEQESDIAFYATNPLLHPISKEIIGADYGALLAFKPPLENKKKVLWEELDVADEFRLYQIIRLAIELSESDGILYIAPKPLDERFQKLAKEKKKTIYYLPLNRFSERNLKKIKRFHLLKSQKTRGSADEYI